MRQFFFLLALLVSLFAVRVFADESADSFDGSAPSSEAATDHNALPDDADIDADADIEIEEATEAPRQLTPEEQERQALLQEAYVAYLKRHATPECRIELENNMEIANPDEQTLSEGCKEDLAKVRRAWDFPFCARAAFPHFLRLARFPSHSYIQLVEKFKAKLVRAQKEGRDPLKAVGAVPKKAKSSSAPKRGVKVRVSKTDDATSVIINVTMFFTTLVTLACTYQCFIRPSASSSPP